MSFVNLDGEYVCVCMCSDCEDEYFSTVRSTSRRFRPPSLASFVEEVAQWLNIWPTTGPSEERPERARDRARHAEVPLVIGTARPNSKVRPDRVRSHALGIF